MVRDWIYRAGTAVLTLVLKVLFHLKVVGREHIPGNTGVKGFLLVARHHSYWDVPILIAALGGRKRIDFLARHTLLRNPFFYPFVKAYAITINRENFGREDFRKVIRALEADRIVGIFPEGTTRPTDQIRVGVIRFAERSGMPFLPVHLDAEGPYPPRYPFCFPRITVLIGRPFVLGELERTLTGAETRRERYERLSQALMARIDDLCERTSGDVRLR